ncbi:fluoroquinolone transport system ATP-binding protein [Paenibacillus phyllosphaerae]|uniref:Fluoroquinolone transport system ATP-binding protein n=1 Tax=Paenibacillus phyllosphaerae TaxID=274593 RepID=A0A7W5B5W0_9BACL|nr:ABC transporter ATP-binding protein [Paenibacillus phyllosphaerae]MBB3114744.1 fluoroquinolone transport system ATP-binding protein [Paenibacillus phyllosphaerae]
MIHVKGLRYTYPDAELQTLHGLDFSVHAGEIFGLLGPSGAGKSTTQKILIGTLKQYEGSAKVLGSEIRQLGTDYYERIGVAFEFPNFYNKFTVLENLRLFRSLYKVDTINPIELLSDVGLEEARNLKVSQLSKGMKMRLNFCRSILHSPEILFLDEPTSGLDPVNAQIIKEMILKIRATGTTVIITTHNMQAAEELCDRVAFIVDGQIKLIDSPRELKLRLGTKQVRVEYRDGDRLRAKEFDLTGIGSNEHFQHILRRYPIETIHSSEATLEEIFIRVTGRSLL